MDGMEIGVWTPEKKAKMVEALRTTKITQNRRSLRRADRENNVVTALCCIGVGDLACGNNNLLYPGWSQSTSMSVNRLGLNRIFVKTETDRGFREILASTWLVGLNDDKKLNFHQIADLIEEHL